MINEGAVAFAAYVNNELDVYGIGAEDIPSIDADAALKAQRVEGPGQCTFYIGYNTKKAPFDDKNVRVAFAKSFDRDAYINDVAKIGKPALAFITPGIPGYDSGETFQKFDATAAKASLAQASPAAQAALAGVKITYASSARNKTRLEWFQNQWKTNLGLNLGLDPVDSTTYPHPEQKPDPTPPRF